ncbi:MAG: hypothetical protein PHU85_16095 [Phycisphaerae bacterium]|nr:hypothetical protein [Phycisphaerae bacterium]
MEQLLEMLLEGDPRQSRRALEALRRPTGKIESAIVEQAVNTAALLLAMGQSEQACVMLESLVGRCGLEPDLLNNLAYAHLVGGRSDRALALWEQAADLAPEDGLIQANLSRARRRRDELLQ